MRKEAIKKLGERLMYDTGADTTMLDSELKKDIFKEIGNKHFREGMFKYGEVAYDKGGIELTPEVYKEIGDLCFEEGYIPDAYYAYKRANDKEGLFEVGKKFIKLDYPGFAKDALKDAGMEITPDLCGEMGDQCIAEKDYLKAIWCYEKGGNKDKIIEVKNICVEEGELWAAEAACKRTNTKLTSDQYIEMGDRCIELGKLEDAGNAYLRVNDRTRLTKVGDGYIKMGNLYEAERTYKDAGKELTPEQYEKIGDLCIEAGKLTDASKSYRKAGRENIAKFIGQL